MIIGNLGNDPDIRTMQNGSKVCNLSIATSESWKDKQTGERKSKSEWHRVVIFNEGLVNVCENYLRKGSKVYIEGQLETRKWQNQQGQDQYSTEIVLKAYNGSLVMLDSKEQSSAISNSNGGYTQQPTHNAGQADDFSDEIPFAAINDRLIV